jgi:hypothetical protein
MSTISSISASYVAYRGQFTPPVAKAPAQNTPREERSESAAEAAAEQRSGEPPNAGGQLLDVQA